MADGVSVQDAGNAAKPVVIITTAALCLQVGWAMRVLYSADYPTRRDPPPDRLPGLDQLTLAETVGVYASQISTAVGKIASAEAWADSLTGELGAITGAAGNPETVRAYGQQPGGDDTLSTAIRALHVALLKRLQSGPGLAKAYALGQSLSEFGRLETDAQLDSAFSASAVVSLDRQLNDLATVLPGHAAKSVVQSLTWWRDLVAVSQRDRPDKELFDTLKNSRTDAPALRRTPQSNGPMIAKAQIPASLRADLIVALPRQTERWRTILVGEKNPLDMLKPEDYLNAGRRLFGRTRDLIRKIPAPIWMVVLVVTALFLAIIAAAFYLTNRSSSADETTKFTASFTATFATVAAYLATLWKGILPRIRSMLTGLEKPMWNAALDFVCAEAVSLPPVGSADSERWSELAKVSRKALDQADSAVAHSSSTSPV